MRSCFAQKILPLALCFAVGVGLAAGAKFLRSVKQGSGGERPVISEAHSRTWLVIKSGLPHRRPVIAHGDGNAISSALFRTRFRADGSVSTVVPLPRPGMSEGWAAACAEVEKINFTPPTEDGRPLAVTADVTCEVAGAPPVPATARGIYYIDTRPLISLSVKIVAVEGASSQEGWRVVYE